MTKTVWKFRCEPGTFSLYMPEGAQVLTVQHQSHLSPAELWAVVDPSKSIEHRVFHIAGTGHQLPDNIKSYISTFLMAGGEFVFHAFELDVS